MPSSLRPLFTELDGLLTQYASLWQVHPFRLRQHGFQLTQPALAACLDALSLEQLWALDEEPAALVACLQPHIPIAERLAELTRLPRLERPCQPVPEPLARFIPGRKLAQLRQFASAMPGVRGPLLEWCAGKGHLGRLLGFQSGQQVVSLEWQAQLCEEGRALAARTGVTMAFVQGDAFAPESDALFCEEQHAVALHACGELHMRLMQSACQRRTRAITLSPCCYHLIRSESYQPMSEFARQSQLQLQPQDLRMAVQETVTAGQRVRRLRNIELSWRLGFDLLQREIRGVDEYLPLPNVQKCLLSGSFAEFVRWAAQVKGLDLQGLPAASALDAFALAGEARLPVVARIELVRHLFRRPLELWLVLDRALYLEEQGYRVTVGEFCGKELTPRNFMLHAERD